MLQPLVPNELLALVARMLVFGTSSFDGLRWLYLTTLGGSWNPGTQRRPTAAMRSVAGRKYTTALTISTKRMKRDSSHFFDNFLRDYYNA